MTARRI